MPPAARPAALALIAGLTFAPILPALAHHGWDWASQERFELSGTVTEIYLGQPHATLTLDVEGTHWTVELAPLSATLASGFDEDAVAVGEDATVIGHRALEESDMRMKAVRVIVGDATYDVYPREAAELDG